MACRTSKGGNEPSGRPRRASPREHAGGVKKLLVGAMAMGLVLVGCGGSDDSAAGTTTTVPSQGLPELPEFRPVISTTTTPPKRDNDGNCVAPEDPPRDAQKLGAADLDGDGSPDDVQAWPISERVGTATFVGFGVSVGGSFGEVSQRLSDAAAPGPFQLLGATVLGKANEQTMFLSVGSPVAGRTRVIPLQVRDCLLVPLDRRGGGTASFEVGLTESKRNGIRCEDTLNLDTSIEAPSKEGGFRIVQLQATLNADASWRVISTSFFVVDGELSSGEASLEATIAAADIGLLLTGFDTITCTGISAPTF